MTDDYPPLLIDLYRKQFAKKSQESLMKRYGTIAAMKRPPYERLAERQAIIDEMAARGYRIRDPSEAA